MADQAVLAVQKWLNETYGGNSGFDKAPENGQTGWATIYSLREGLQHELGLTLLGQGFGDTTKNAASAVVGSLRAGYSGNIAKLVQGAFWCKGISPIDFSTKYTSNTVNAVKELQSDAGLTPTGSMSVPLLAALFDMSAFVLVANGDSKVRRMQQNLNGKFASELQEIMPCDGIYQRATNKELIYALQRAIGINASVANGNYGPGTVSATPTVYPGTNSDIVQVIQYGLYVNGFYNGAFDGYFSSDVSNGIVSFRKFMNLPPFTSTADLTVIKGLVTSNGNTNRDSDTFDAATQLNSSLASTLRKYDFKIAGRYLTGSVGTGSSKRDKNLTPQELSNLTQAGISVIPIYEDGGYEIEYFTRSQGIKDAAIATSAAAKLGFPAASTIYFAVDVDILDGDIDGTVVPYFQGIAQSMNHSIYHTGIYGTRNVCTRVSKASGTDVLYSYVADMSYGWSGNLGFKMPSNWAFDQFTEYGFAGIDIDQVASSGKDTGADSFDVNDDTIRLDWAKSVINQMNQLKPIQPLLPGLKVDGPEVHVSNGLVDIDVKLSSSYSGDYEGAPIGLNIKNGKVTTQINEQLDKFQTVFEDAKNQKYLSGLASLAPLVGNGQIKTGISAKNGLLGFKVILTSSTDVYHNGKKDTLETSLTIEVYTKKNGLGFTEPIFTTIYKPVEVNSPDLSWVPFAFVLSVGIAAILIAPEAAPAIASFIAAALTKAAPAVY